MIPLHPLKIMLSALFLCVLLSVVVIAGEPTAQRAFKWQSAAPEEVGLSTEALSALHRDLLAGKYGYIDSFLIVRHQKIVFEQYFSHDYAAIYGEEARAPGPLVINDPTGPYNYFNAFWHPFYKGTTLHTLQSVTKSVVSLTLGMAIARGDLPSLDTPVLSFFDASVVANVDDRKRRMTLRHLLNMSTGLEWDERLPYSDPANTFTIMAKSLDWVRYTLDAPMTSEPGTVFNYNSGATLVLGHIFRVATGIDIEEYALRHLLEPLGIEEYYWDRTPSGLADAQEGLYLSTRDLGRLCCWCTSGALMVPRVGCLVCGASWQLPLLRVFLLGEVQLHPIAYRVGDLELSESGLRRSEVSPLIRHTELVELFDKAAEVRTGKRHVIKVPPLGGGWLIDTGPLHQVQHR